MRVNGQDGPSPPKLNNRALNCNLWSRDVELSFIRPWCSRWSDSARPLWHPSCMSACNPGLQDHLKYLSFDDARLVSLARVRIVNVRKFVYVPWTQGVAPHKGGPQKCPHCDIGFQNEKQVALHTFGACCPQLLVPRESFLCDVTPLVDSRVLSFCEVTRARNGPRQYCALILFVNLSRPPDSSLPPESVTGPQLRNSFDRAWVMWM